MLKRLLAKMGSGSAKVDLRIHKPEYAIGETVSGEIVVFGGEVEQDIRRMDVDLVLAIWYKGREVTKVVDRYAFPQSFRVQPKSQYSFPFQFTLPSNLLISGHTVSYFFLTHLDIMGAVDSTDRDFIKIAPPDRLQRILTALQSIGFYEKHNSRSYDGYSQEFEFAPTTYHSLVREVEFRAMIEEAGVRLLLEVDLPGFFGEREVRREVWLDNQLLENAESLAQYLHDSIQEMAAQPNVFMNTHSQHFSYYNKESHYGYGHHGHHHHDHSHHHHHHHGHHHGSGVGGMIGGFAAGMIAGELLEEAFDDDDSNDRNGFFDGDDGGGFDFGGGDDGDWF